MYAIAESIIDPAKYWKLGEQLGYSEAKLKQWEKDNEKSILKATYAMLCDRLENMSDSQWMNTLMTACNQCGLKNILLHLKEGVFLFLFMIRRKTNKQTDKQKQRNNSPKISNHKDYNGDIVIQGNNVLYSLNRVVLAIRIRPYRCLNCLVPPRRLKTVVPFAHLQDS